MKPTLAFDLEIYSNYFLAMFRNVETGNTRSFELHDGQPLDIATIKAIVAQYRLVSFNGNHFDMPILALALLGANNRLLKAGCDAIINGGLKSWQFEKKFNVTLPKADHIDLIEVAPGIASLKIYGGRMHCQKMQDLPIEPSALILPEQHAEMREYCANDLATTIELFNTLAAQIKLREQMSNEYGQDLRSKSDAQIAEAVIKTQVAAITGAKVERPEVHAGTRFAYRTPEYIQFSTTQLRDVLAMVERVPFVINDSGKVLMPKDLSMGIQIGASTYALGMGGLHSTEQSSAHFSDEHNILVDRDVASYYPEIILRSGLAPKHMGRAFLKVYRGIVERRLAAKHSGDKVIADSLKITINGSFGKFGSKWSVLYAPDLLIQTTLTGQLALLMLIEHLEGAGIPIVSANTDGIVIKCPRHREDDMENIVAAWEMVTGFDTEATYYKALYSKDVNNYIAVKDGSVKMKGVYATTGLSKSPANTICVDAVIKYLVNGIPLRATIEACQDIRKFVNIRTVKGGAIKDDVPLGKAIRWYYAKGVEGTIKYKINGYTVPRTEGARPLMELSKDLPADIDYDWYVREAESIVNDIGGAK